MADGIKYPISFGTTPLMVLENGTTHFAQRLVTKSRRAVISYITLPDQTIYDLDGTDPAPTVPETVTAVVVVILPSPVWLDDEWEAWEAHVGYRATLSAIGIGTGPTFTCAARLESLTNVTPFQDRITGNQMIVEAVFRPITNWT
jgi:hypothetical protein